MAEAKCRPNASIESGGRGESLFRGRQRRQLAKRTHRIHKEPNRGVWELSALAGAVTAGSLSPQDPRARWRLNSKSDCGTRRELAASRSDLFFTQKNSLSLYTLAARCIRPRDDEFVAAQREGTSLVCTQVIRLVTTEHMRHPNAFRRVQSVRPKISAKPLRQA